MSFSPLNFVSNEFFLIKTHQKNIEYKVFEIYILTGQLQFDAT